MADDTCSIDGCENRRTTRGWCNMHYRRWLNGRPLGGPEPISPNPTRPPRFCSIAGCSNRHNSRGWCLKHYERWRAHGDPEKVTVIRGDDRARFWSYVDTSGGQDACWPWTGRTNQDGYGDLKLNGRTVLAHRTAFHLHHGYWPTPFACHHCDNPPCVNPDHLYEGTAAENTRDREERTHTMRGSGNPQAKITESEVRAIRDLSAHGVKTRVLVDRFGISSSQVQKIVRRASWADVV